jgi:hypothetical protein
VKTLTGVAFVGLVVLGPPPDVSARVIEVKVDLAMEGSECVGNIDASKKVSKTKRDVLVWNMASTCTTPQQVRVCISGGKLLRKCNGEPEYVNVGKKFTVESGMAGTPASALATCHVKWSVLNDYPQGRRFLIEVLNGSATDDLKCIEKPVCQGPVCPESELALEVEP